MSFSVVFCRANPSTGLPEHTPLPGNHVPRARDIVVIAEAGMELRYTVTEVQWHFRPGLPLVPGCERGINCEVVVFGEDGDVPALRSATIAARHALFATLESLPAFEQFRIDVGALPSLAGKAAARSWLTTLITLQASLRASVALLDEYGGVDEPGPLRQKSALALSRCETTLESLLQLFNALLDDRFPAPPSTGAAS